MRQFRGRFAGQAKLRCTDPRPACLFCIGLHLLGQGGKGLWEGGEGFVQAHFPDPPPVTGAPDGPTRGGG